MNKEELNLTYEDLVQLKRNRNETIENNKEKISKFIYEEINKILSINKEGFYLSGYDDVELYRTRNEFHTPKDRYDSQHCKEKFVIHIDASYMKFEGFFNYYNSDGTEHALLRDDGTEYFYNNDNTFIITKSDFNESDEKNKIASFISSASKNEREALKILIRFIKIDKLKKEFKRRYKETYDKNVKGLKEETQKLERHNSNIEDILSEIGDIEE